MNADLKQYGLRYIEKGFSIIPVGKNKSPLVDWKQYQTKRATKAEFLVWLEQYPEMQIGIITGAISNLVVVDIDDYKKGFKLDFELPKTLQVRTGSGGTHYYYTHSQENVPNAADHVKKWDIRGDGGYVIAPPSFNENGQYVFLNKNKMVELPAELLAMARAREEEKQNRVVKPVVQRNFGGTIFDQLAALDCRTGLETLSGASCVNGEQYSFRHRSGGGAVIDINGKTANCWINPDGTIGSDTLGARGKRGCPTLVQWLAWYGHEKEKMAEVIKQIFHFKDQPIVFEKSQSKNSYTWGLDCIDEKISTLKKRTLTILLADENAGKSTFAFFFGRKNAEKYGHRVVLYSLESTEKELFQMNAFNYADVSRIEERDETYLENPKYQERMKELQSDKKIKIIGRTAAASTKIEDIECALAREGVIDLLIIDNLTCVELAGRKYNENEAIKEIIQKLISLSENLDAPIVLVHHYRKSQNKSIELFRGIHEASGSGVIKNLAHKVIQVARKRGEDLAPDDQAEFHIREGKVRTRAGDNEFMIYYQNGTFSEVYQGRNAAPRTEVIDIDFTQI